MHQNYDQFGFYCVGKDKYYSKIEAIEAHARTGIHLHWDFNESVFSQFDWTKEPVESLSELYRRRAQQLRDKYDYLVLWYSSGADSEAVLQAFTDNDIKLDEVASFVNYEGNGDKNDYAHNGEIFHIAVDRIKKHQETYPDMKHRVIDVCQPAIDRFSTVDKIHDWKYTINLSWSPHGSVRSNLIYTVKEWKDMISSGKRVGFIWGVDKPRLYQQDGKYCVRFIDSLDMAVTPQWQNHGGIGEFRELFFWTPDMPEIVIKQGHIVKNYLKSTTPSSQHLRIEPTWLGYVVHNDITYWLTSVGLSNLIYPGFEYNALNMYKPSSIIWTDRDNWFFKMSKTNESKRIWEAAVSDLWNNLPEYWRNDPSDIRKAVKGCFSKPYFLE